MGRLMKALAARATRYRNRLEGRSGTLWEGRYESSPVQMETYLLACTRYIELNLAWARMVPAAGDYAWSGFRQRMGEEERWIDLDPAYLELGGNESRRQARYARFVEQGVPEPELKLMREALQRGSSPVTSASWTRSSRLSVAASSAAAPAVRRHAVREKINMSSFFAPCLVGWCAWHSSFPVGFLIL